MMNVAPQAARPCSRLDLRKLSASGRPVVRQFLWYMLNCGQVLALKLVLVVVLTGWLAPAIAYLLIHVVTFFVSYAIHVRRTFRAQPGRRTLLGYLATVIGFKAFDYLFFNLLVAWNLAVTASVLVASAVEAVVRFIVVRRVLAGKPVAAPDAVAADASSLSPLPARTGRPC